MYGLLLHKVKSVDVNESMAIIWNSFLRYANAEGEIPPNGVPFQRFILAAALVDSQNVADILLAEVPGACERVPKGALGKSTFQADQSSADSRKVQMVLGLKFWSAEKTFGESGRQLLELKKAV
ncbi:nad dependent epimerase [Paraphaeosphaeria minitans]|uniref:Nad dependent epimerase n=1 Tax=Paraphaeosphaeria minitans TaxID=565426 RepID=A0A9P6GTV8_9PLEO|nr:nad dependent epimerase [Paraphaeosphaeria minitans]